MERLRGGHCPCAKKEQLLGGGVAVDNDNVNEFTAALENGPTAWHARMQNGRGQRRTMTVTALYLKK